MPAVDEVLLDDEETEDEPPEELPLAEDFDPEPAPAGSLVPLAASFEPESVEADSLAAGASEVLEAERLSLR